MSAHLWRAITDAPTEKFLLVGWFMPDGSFQQRFAKQTFDGHWITRDNTGIGTPDYWQPELPPHPRPDFQGTKVHPAVESGKHDDPRCFELTLVPGKKKSSA